MIQDHRKMGGVAVGRLDSLPPWEANLVTNLRLWSDSPERRELVWAMYEINLPTVDAQHACHSLQTLISTIVSLLPRPFLTHQPGCNCLGADESVFLHLVRLASDDLMNDASLMAALLVGPVEAPRLAVMASHVGRCARATLTDAHPWMTGTTLGRQHLH